MVLGKDHDDTAPHTISQLSLHTGKPSQKKNQEPKRNELHSRKRQASDSGQEQHECHSRPLHRTLIRVVRTFRDEGENGHGSEGDRPALHAHTESIDDAESAEEEGHRELHEDRHEAHDGERLPNFVWLQRDADVKLSVLLTLH